MPQQAIHGQRLAPREAPLEVNLGRGRHLRHSGGAAAAERLSAGPYRSVFSDDVRAREPTPTYRRITPVISRRERSLTSINTSNS